MWKKRIKKTFLCFRRNGKNGAFLVKEVTGILQSLPTIFKFSHRCKRLQLLIAANYFVHKAICCGLPLLWHGLAACLLAGASTLTTIGNPRREGNGRMVAGWRRRSGTLVPAFVVSLHGPLLLLWKLEDVGGWWVLWREEWAALVPWFTTLTAVCTGHGWNAVASLSRSSKSESLTLYSLTNPLCISSETEFSP